MRKVYSVVVLYHPDQSILRNINSYIDQVDTLFVIDNSEEKNIGLIQNMKRNPKIQYIDNHGNQGIAHALNIGATLAITSGADWLLTMDQDSWFEKGTLFKMIKWINENKTDNIGIVSPMHSINTRDNYKRQHDLVTMTSGNLLNLDIFQKIGHFEEKLFIDSVDTEYCLRLNLNNYRIKRFKSIVLEHNLGYIQRKNFLFANFTVTNHNAIRRYYITRNRFYVWKKYKEYFPWFINYEKNRTIKEIIKLLLGEDDKILKIKMIIQGYWDFKKNKFGKLDI